MNSAKQPVVIRRPSSSTGPSSTTIRAVPSREEVAEMTRTKIADFLQLIVDHPEELNITVTHGERTTIFKVDCSKRNFSKILGSKGKMISSIRNMTLAITARYGFRSIVEIPYYAPSDSMNESSDPDHV